MNTALMIYLYFSIGSMLGGIAAFLAVTSACLLLALLIGLEERDSDTWKKLLGYFKLFAIPLAIVLLLSSWYPTKDTIKYMIAGTVVVEAGKLDGIERLPQNVVDLANSFLEQANVSTVVEEVIEGNE